MAAFDSDEIIQFRQGNDVIGYHVYRSTDPELPKDQWVRLTSTPVPDTNFRDMAAADTTYLLLHHGGEC